MSALSDALARAKTQWEKLDPAEQTAERWLWTLRNELERETNRTPNPSSGGQHG